MKKLLFLLLMGTTVWFTSCDDDDNDDPGTGTETATAELSGDITGTRTLDADTTYTLTGTCSIKSGGTLSIPAGTTIKCSGGFDSYVIVEQGGTIDAEGTSSAPIIFTSGEDSPAAADWGGIILNGYGILSGGSGTTASCEMDATVTYGGSNSSDNSGTLKYVQILYSGAQSSESIEHNGLTLDGVGSGTTIENIYVAYGADDAVEFFGGSVNVTNLLAVNCDDDMFDVTQGWTGTLTNAYGIWKSGFVSTEDDPRGIEVDGNLDGKNPDQTDQSDFTMADITIKNAADQEMTDAVKIRRGATATITNLFITGGSTDDLIDLTDGKGLSTDDTKINVTVENMVVNGNNVTSQKDLDEDGTISDDEICNATVTFTTENTGADESAFDWTGYDFSSDEVASSIEISGEVADGEEYNLSSFNTYTLTGTLSVKSGGVLNIEEGTTILCSGGFDSYVIVEQGGQIFAEGTADEPIIFTSGEDTPAAADWGGIILNGYGILSGGAGTTASCEMDANVTYGGSDATDNSGTLSYVQILYSGAQSSESIEHNGLTLDAVGSGTTINNIYIAEGADDAIEFFGGSVNVTNLLSVNCDDDMFDVTQGWTGTLDNAYGKIESDFISTEEDPRGIEADGNLDGKNPDQTNQSDFTMKNITINNSSSTQELTDGIKIRRGATATISNALLINGSTDDLIDLTDGKGLSTDNTVIDVTYTDMTVAGNEVNTEKDLDEDGTISSDEICNATVTVNVNSNTGADTGVFAWTGYSF